LSWVGANYFVIIPINYLTSTKVILLPSNVFKTEFVWIRIDLLITLGWARFDHTEKIKPYHIRYPLIMSMDNATYPDQQITMFQNPQMVDHKSLHLQPEITKAVSMSEKGPRTYTYNQITPYMVKYSSLTEEAYPVYAVDLPETRFVKATFGELKEKGLLHEQQLGSLIDSCVLISVELWDLYDGFALSTNPQANSTLVLSQMKQTDDKSWRRNNCYMLSHTIRDYIPHGSENKVTWYDAMLTSWLTVGEVVADEKPFYPYRTFAQNMQYQMESKFYKFTFDSLMKLLEVTDPEALDMNKYISDLYISNEVLRK
jgi:hypothetical protein